MFSASGDSPYSGAASSSSSSTAMRLCYNGAATLLAATACPAAFVDLDSIREEPHGVSPRHFERDDSVFSFQSALSSTFGSPTDEFPTAPSSSSSSPFKFMESIQRKRKSMFRRNQSSSSLVSEKRRTFRRPSLPSIPPTIDEMSSSVGHARSRRPSLHNDWTNEHHRERMGIVDNRIHHIDIEPSVNTFKAICKDIDDSVEEVPFDFNQRLYEAFELYLRARRLTINDVEFFLEKSSTPIPENAEARYLAGHTIFVRGRGNMKVVRHTRAAHSMDESNERATRKMSAEAVSRKSSFVNSRILNKGSRNHPGLNGSDDAECRSNDSSLSVRDNWQYDEPSCSEAPDDGGTRRARSVTSSRISLFFGKEKNDEMIRQLNHLKDQTEKDNPVHKLEEDWREIVRDHQNLSERSIKQQGLIWEIVTTESNYIRLLRYLSDLSYYLTSLQANGYMKDVDNQFVFHNFFQLFHVNWNFLWTPAIIPLVENSRVTGRPLDVNILKAGFLGIENWSREYTRFHFAIGESMRHIQKRLKDNEQFRDFVAWAELHESIDRHKLIDTFSRPMQQLTRYNLLLKALLKVPSDEKEREMLRSLVESTEKATMQLNCEMNNNDLKARLEDIMRTIEGPDFVDPDEIHKLFGHRFPLDLTQVMPNNVYRRIFLRGDLKMQEGKKGSKIDVHCMIYTDMFLICRKVQGKKDRLKYIRPPMHMAKLIFHPFADQCGFYLIPFTDFKTAAALYCMHTGNPEDTLQWTEMLHVAFREFNNVNGSARPLKEHESPLDEYNRGGFFMEPPPVYDPRMMPPGYLPHVPVIHRKCSSMDSQAVAAHAHLNYMHRSSAVSSTEQLDRHNGLDSKFAPPRHKLSVASCHANPLSSSKSSVDLYVPMGAENGDIERPRSRSNSSGPDIEGLKQRSRSPSPARKEMGTPVETDSPLQNTPCRDSPTLLITPDDSAEPSQSGRRFEKRYHTADGIDVHKPKGSMISNGILKRFSWNVSSSMGGSSRKKLESNSRRSSQACNVISHVGSSMDSFGSSTSGISTASSTNNNNDPSMEAMTTKLSHISTISINDTPTNIEPQATLSISLEAPPPVVHEKVEEIEVSVPPPPELPPPSKTPSPNLPSQKSDKKCQPNELLKFIMDNNLETSDV